MSWNLIAREVVDDGRQTLRTLRRSPGFVVVAVIILALGCAITGAVFSTINGWLSAGNAIPHVDRLVVVAPVQDGTADTDAHFAEASYRRLFELRLRTLRHLFATAPFPATLVADEGTTSVRMETVTGACFQAVGVVPLLGRVLVPEDDQRGGAVSVVLGEEAWRRFFNADPTIVGRRVRVSGLPATIVGVIPFSLHGFNNPTSMVVDLWAPAEAVRSVVVGLNGELSGVVFGRLVDGVSLEEAQAEMRVVGARPDPDTGTARAAVLPAERGLLLSKGRLGFRVIGTGLVALASLVLLIACANLANLLLARSAGRAPEVALRMALGASPSRVVRLHLFESSVVTLLGGLAGFLLVRSVSGLIGQVMVRPEGRSTMTGVMLVDAWTLAFFLLLVAVASVAIGILPALRAIRTDPAQVLASAGAHGTATGRFEQKRTLLVASQVAASTVLLVVAGLFVRSALHASDYAVTFDARRVGMGHFDFARSGWSEPRGHTQQEAVLLAARAIPGIRGAALTTGLPAFGAGERVPIEAEEANLGRREFGPPCRCLAVSPGFFEVLGRRPLRGRDFDEGDRAGGRGVAIVNEVAASLLWPRREAIGRRMRVRKGDVLDVVGVVASTDRTARDVADRCYVFVPMAQRYSPRFVLVVAGGPAGAAPVGPLTATLARQVPDVAMFGVTTAEAYLNQSGGVARAVALALGVLGAIGLTIAVVGLYGVMTYTVGLRRAEFGIRKALGASHAQVYGLVLSDAGRMVGIGVLCGLPIAYAVSVAVEKALVGVTAHDAVTYLGVPACLLLVGAVSAWWPARRAARVQPTDALRQL